MNAPSIKPLTASKWLKLQALLETEELKELFSTLQPMKLFYTGRVVEVGKEEIPPNTFLDHYETYISKLREGEFPEAIDFAAALSRDPEALYTIPIDARKRLLKPRTPVIQLQTHTISYSPLDKKFRSMVFGQDAILWGIQFSYPQICESPDSKQILIVKEQEQFSNTALFHELQKWVRRHTLPTPFVVEGIKTNVPIRLGKKCLSWINRHPQLVKLGVTIDCEH